MLLTCLTLLLINIRQFCVGSIQSVVVSYLIVLLYKTVRVQFALMEESGEEDLPELLELEEDKAGKIRQLEMDLERMGSQLLEARNRLNSLVSELAKYKRIQGQLSWAIVRQCDTIAAAGSQQPPPPPPLPPPPPPDTASCNVSVASGDSTGLSTESDDWDAESPPPPLVTICLDAGPSSVEAEDDGWETTDEGEFGPDPSSTPDTESDLTSLLVNVTPRTHISEIFRRWNNSAV
uniref:Uncharacterized protein n=1 Tax=Graphocephala atropunctata TaxID=36148 RepID=A0A1B6MV97_9HEMI